MSPLIIYHLVSAIILSQLGSVNWRVVYIRLCMHKPRTHKDQGEDKDSQDH